MMLNESRMEAGLGGGGGGGNRACRSGDLAPAAISGAPELVYPLGSLGPHNKVRTISGSRLRPPINQLRVLV